MSRYPQEAAAWRGIQPSLSGWLMQAPCSTRKVTMSTLSSMHAWDRGEMGRKRIRPQLLDCVELSALGYMHTCLSAYVSGVACAVVASLMERALHPRIGCHVHCWEILAAEAFSKCSHIAGVLEIPHSIVLLTEALGCCAYICCYFILRVI